jgi:hypothetical protein
MAFFDFHAADQAIPFKVGRATPRNGRTADGETSAD